VLWAGGARACRSAGGVPAMLNALGALARRQAGPIRLVAAAAAVAAAVLLVRALSPNLRPAVDWLTRTVGGLGWGGPVLYGLVWALVAGGRPPPTPPPPSPAGPLGGPPGPLAGSAAAPPAARGALPPGPPGRAARPRRP